MQHTTFVGPALGHGVDFSLRTFARRVRRRAFGRGSRGAWTALKRLPLAAGLGLAMTLGLPAAAADAATVTTTPASWTPYLLESPVNKVVEELEPCNGVMDAVGTMTAVGRGSATYTRSNAFSFSAITGVMTSWAPQVNGTVRSIAFSPDCSTAYLGGIFSSVNGIASTNLVAVDTVTGAVRTGFNRHTNAAVYTVRYTHGAVIIGGAFTNVNGVSRTRMASLNPTTGAVTSYLNFDISGTYPPTECWPALTGRCSGQASPSGWTGHRCAHLQSVTREVSRTSRERPESIAQLVRTPLRAVLRPAGGGTEWIGGR